MGEDSMTFATAQKKIAERFRTPEQKIALDIGHRLIDAMDDASHFGHVSQDWRDVSFALQDAMRHALFCMEGQDRADLAGVV